jgi:hypothetical protein
LKIYLDFHPEDREGEMMSTIRRLHRMLVDRLAETSWLRDKAGANSKWWHYEHHARAANKAAANHANAKATAKRWAGAPHRRRAGSEREGWRSR